MQGTSGQLAVIQEESARTEATTAAIANAAAAVAGDRIKELLAAEAKAQEFFAELAAEVRKPHYGGPAREFTQAILLRAIERGLYTPEKP